MQKVTENYLSKVTRYCNFVTEQHCLENTHCGFGSKDVANILDSEVLVMA